MRMTLLYLAAAAGLALGTAGCVTRGRVVDAEAAKSIAEGALRARYGSEAQAILDESDLNVSLYEGTWLVSAFPKGCKEENVFDPVTNTTDVTICYLGNPGVHIRKRDGKVTFVGRVR